MIGRLRPFDRSDPGTSSTRIGRGNRLIGLLRVVIPLLVRVTPEEVEMLLAAAAQMRTRYAIWRTAIVIRTLC